MFRSFLALLASSLLIFPIFAQSGSKNIDAIDSLDYALDLSDVWGYAAPSGREYALVGVQNGLSIVDLDTMPIMERHFLPGPSSIWRDIKVFGDYAYVSNETGGGLRIVDLSGLPGSVSYHDTVISGITTIHNLWIDELGRLYIAGANQLSNGLVVLNLNNDPWHPILMGSYNDSYVHDVYVRNGRAYTGELSNGLTIVNMGIPSIPSIIGNQTYSGNFTHNTWLNDAGDVCFTTDETGGAYIQAWDVSDPSDIQFLDKIRSPLSGGITIPHNVHVKDDILITSYYKDGVYIVDGSHPTHLVEIGYYDTSPTSGGGFAGCWGAYPFLPSGRLLATDIEEGLFLLQPTYVGAAFLHGAITDSLSGLPLSDVNVNLFGSGETDLSDANGEYLFGFEEGGNFTLTLSKPGYETKSFLVTMSPGLDLIEDVALKPLGKNVDFVEVLPYNNDLSDVWGYVAPDGHEYALVGVFNGVSIVDLDVSPILERHFIPGPSTIWRDLKTYGDYAYVSNESDNGLLIIDLSNLPGTVSYRDTVVSGIETIHNLWVDDLGRLYIAGANEFNGGLAILDLTADPSRPDLVGIYNDEYVHDVYVRNGLAYNGELGVGLTVLNVTDATNPIPIGNQTYAGNFTHNTWLNDAGDVCFTTDETSAAYIQAWDVSDPSNIQFLDKIRSELSGGVTIPHNVHVLDDYLVTSYYTDGIHIVDASHPTALVEVGHYDTSPLSGSGFFGCWGAYPFLPSGRLLATDIEEGLFVLQPDYQRAAFLLGNVTDSVTGVPVGGVEIGLVGTGENDFSGVSGEYIFGIADGGSYSITFSKYGYVSKTLSVSLTQGMETILDVELVPLDRLSFEVIVLNEDSTEAIEGAMVRAIAPANLATFDYLTDIDGRAVDNYFVANTYEVQVGKWGFVTRSLTVNAVPGSAPLVVLLDSGYYDDFVFDFEWSVQDNARTGIWVRDKPIGTIQNLELYNPSADIQGDIGDQAYVTGNGGGGIGFDDVDDGRTSFLSPPMDLSEYNEPLIQYHWWLVNQSSSGNPGDDFLRVEITNGAISIPIRQYIDPQSNQWKLEDSIRVEDYLPKSQPIQIRFLTQDLGNPNIVEAGIDGFQIIEGEPDVVLPPDTTTSIAAMLPESAFVISPQPVQDRMTIRYELPPSQGNWEFVLYNVQGQLLERRDLSGLEGQMSLDFRYSSGIYLGQLKRNGETVLTKKIVK